MRSLTISTVSLLLIIAVWFGFMTYCEDSLTDLTNLISNDIEPDIIDGDWESAALSFDGLSRDWHDRQDLYSVFFTHSEVIQADLSIARAETAIRSRDASIALSELAAIREHLKFLFENERINLANII